MGDHQRQSVLMRRSLVNEMDIKPVDFGGELIEAVQRGFARPPVVTVGPVRRQFTGVGQGYALAPVVDTLGFRPTGVRQAGLQIIENVGWDIDAKRLEFGHTVHSAGNGERQVSAGGQMIPPNRRFLQVPQNQPDAVASQNAPRRPAHVVAGREGHLDHSKLVVGFRLELEDHAALVESFRLEDCVMLAATVDIGYRVT